MRDLTGGSHHPVILVLRKSRRLGRRLLGDDFVLARTRQIVLLETRDERSTRDAEQLGGLRLVARALLERAQDEIALDLLDAVAQPRGGNRRLGDTLDEPGAQRLRRGCAWIEAWRRDIALEGHRRRRRMA